MRCYLVVFINSSVYMYLLLHVAQCEQRYVCVAYVVREGNLFPAYPAKSFYNVCDGLFSDCVSFPCECALSSTAPSRQI